MPIRRRPMLRAPQSGWVVHGLRHLRQVRFSTTCSVTRARSRGMEITCLRRRTLPPCVGSWQSGQLADACSTRWVGSSRRRTNPWSRTINV